MKFLDGNLSNSKRIAFLGIIALVIIVVLQIIPVYYSEIKPPADNALQLVDINFIDSDEFPILDIAIRNTGEKVAFVKRANFNVMKIWEPIMTVPVPIPASYTRISWNYDIMLPTKGAPYSIPTHISQSIEPNAVDRFTFTLGNDDVQAKNDYIFLMKLELIYNENDKSLTSPNLLFVAGGTGNFSASYGVSEYINSSLV